MSAFEIASDIIRTLDKLTDAERAEIIRAVSTAYCGQCGRKERHPERKSVFGGCVHGKEDFFRERRRML